MVRKPIKAMQALAVTGSAVWLFASTAHAADIRSAASVMERFEVEESRAAFGDARFGDIGDYQLIRGKAHVRVRRDHPANRGIVDLDRAPRTQQGDVRYTAEVMILRPREASHARRIMIVEVPNRGMRLALDSLNGGGAMSDLTAMMQGKAMRPPYSGRESAGSAFLYRRGYTLVWVGWQSNLPTGTPLMRADLPVATEGGKPITGRVEATAVFDTTEARSELALPYALAFRSEGNAVLTVRARPDAQPRTLPRSAWRMDGSRKVLIDRPTDMDAGALYQFTYTATDPVVAGLGLAATRDILTFLRRGEPDEAGGANPLADLRTAPCAIADRTACTAANGDSVDLVIGTGISQSGRYLRDMIWQGFNDDGSGRRVFDGMLVQIAGSRKTFTNRRWAVPERFSRQHEDPFVYGNQFPFGYGVTTDPVTGRHDGVFAACERTGTCPKLFHIDGSSEFWNAGGSLVANDGAGRDLPLPADVRAYFVAGAPHAAGLVNASSLLPPNPLSAMGTVRALVSAMDAWLSGSSKPPASRWPSLRNGELAPPQSRSAVGFPDFAAMPYSGVANPVVVTDYDAVPPRPDARRAWQVLVPTTDADGNDRASIRLPEVAVPEGTYMGWNPRRSGFGAGDLSFVFGSYVPFAATRVAQVAARDPRLSLAERYGSVADLRQRQERAKRQLSVERLYLDADE